VTGDVNRLPSVTQDDKTLAKLLEGHPHSILSLTMPPAVIRAGDIVYIFVLDTSGSMCGQTYTAARAYQKALRGMDVPETTIIHLVTFNYKSTVSMVSLRHLDTHPAIDYGGGTYLLE
jgi:hypothetical protein